MADQAITLNGDVVEDDRQLDGSRHLVLDLTDRSGVWFASLELTVDREGRLYEGALAIDGPTGPGSAALTDVRVFRMDPVLELDATFGETEVGDEAAPPRGWALRLPADGPDPAPNGGLSGVLVPLA